MKEMEERQDKFLDKALDELQGTVAETFSKFDERLSSLETSTKDQRTHSTVAGLTAARPSRPHVRTQNLPTQVNLPAQIPLTQRARYLGSASAAHADARNPRPLIPPSTLPSATASATAPHSSTTASDPGLGPYRLRGGAAPPAAGDGDAPLDQQGVGGGEYREAALKVEDVGAFEGKDVEHYIRTLEIISNIYGERRLLLILPRCMKGVAKEWFISIPVDDRHLTRSLAGWSYLLRDGFGEDLRRSKERAASRVYRPWKESVEDYFYDKAAMHKRAEPDITEVELMREIWKGLSPHSPELMVVSWHQYSQRDFRAELIQRQDVIDRSRRRSRFGRGDLDSVDKRGDRLSDPRPDKDFWRDRDRGRGSRWRDLRGVHYDDELRHRGDEEEKRRRRDDDEKERRRGRDSKLPPGSKGYHTTAQDVDVECAGTDAKCTSMDAMESLKEDDEDIPYISDSSRSTTYRVELMGSFSSFLRSRTVSVAGQLPIVDLPTPPSIGGGVSYLNGHPLPIEV